MNPLELLIVARRFWPHCSLSELSLSNLACNLRDAGHHVTVATLKWSREWSEQVEFEGVRVVRFSRPATGPWAAMRYARSFARHFEATRYDGIIASGLGDESVAAMRAADAETPVILRVDEPCSPVPDPMSRRHLETCAAADTIVVSNRALASRLNSIGGLPPVELIDDGLAADPPDRDRQQLRLHLRKSLSDAHPVLRIDPKQPLVVATVPMNQESGLEVLIQAWPHVLSRLPNARLWLPGEGKQSSSLWQQISRKELGYSIILPGHIDTLRDFYRVADLCVHTGNDESPTFGTQLALAVGTPVLAADSDAAGQLIEHGVNGLLLPGHQIGTWASAIVGQFSQIKTVPEIRTRSTAQAAIDTIARKFPPRRQSDRYVALLAAGTGQSLATVR